MRRYVRGGSAQKLDWLVVEKITQLDMALWADLACVGLNADVKFLLLGDFLKWLRVGEEACPTLEQAKARLKELYPSKPGWPDTTLVISHSKRMAVNAAANRALAPEASKLLELETQVIHIDLGETQNGCRETATPQNSPQSMRVWPGLRLIGAGGKIPKGVFVAVAEVEPDGVRLDNGMRLKNQELLRATQPSHAQGLTLHNRVRSPATSRCATCTWATSSELLEAA